MTIFNVMLGRGRGGLEAVAYQYARLFAARGHVSGMVCHKDSPYTVAANVRRLPVCSASRFNLATYLQILWYAWRYAPDVVFCHGNRAVGFVMSWLVKPLLPRRTRIIGVAHNANVRRFREMDCVIAVSESVRDELVRVERAPVGRVRCCWNAVAVPGMAAPPPEGSVPVVGFLGRLVPAKGVDVLLDACAQLKARGVAFRLVIGGDGPDRPALEAQAKEKGLADVVRWAGWVTDKAAFFKDVSLAVMPSRKEPFGLVMLEAMAAARPVVVSDCTMPAEVVRRAQCGLVVPREDSAALADALEELLRDPEKRREMGRLGRAAAESTYSEARLGKELENIVLHCDVAERHSLTPGRLRVLALMATDALTLFLVWLATVVLYDTFIGIDTYKPAIYWKLWPIIPFFIGMNAVCRLYHGNWMYPAMPLSPVEEFRRLFVSSVFAHLLLMSLLGFSRHNLQYSRLIVAIAGLATGLLAQSLRNIVREILFRLRICQIPVALAGSTETARRVKAILADNAHIGFDIVQTFDNAHLADIVPECQKRDVKILLACEDERLFRAQLREFSEWFNCIEFMPRYEVFPVFGGHAVSIDGIGGLEMVNQGRMKAIRWQKTLLDYTLSVFVFLLVSPLFVLIPLLIKLTGRGPVFYRSERLGLHGKPFRIWKFRSMYADADARLQELLANDPVRAAEYRANFKLRHDPRVTPLGRLLRKTSLDELPQLFNVFRGEMSLIGPRPIVKAEVKYYGGDYEVFSRVKPGITGLWQCSGRSDTDYTRRVSLDVYYILNWSPWMDIWILLRTAAAVLGMKGAV